MKQSNKVSQQTNSKDFITQWIEAATILDRMQRNQALNSFKENCKRALSFNKPKLKPHPKEINMIMQVMDYLVDLNRVQTFESMQKQFLLIHHVIFDFFKPHDLMNRLTVSLNCPVNIHIALEEIVQEITKDLKLITPKNDYTFFKQNAEDFLHCLFQFIDLRKHYIEHNYFNAIPDRYAEPSADNRKSDSIKSLELIMKLLLDTRNIMAHLKHEGALQKIRSKSKELFDWHNECRDPSKKVKLLLDKEYIPTLASIEETYLNIQKQLKKKKKKKKKKNSDSANNNLNSQNSNVNQNNNSNLALPTDRKDSFYGHWFDKITILNPIERKKALKSFQLENERNFGNANLQHDTNSQELLEDCNPLTTECNAIQRNILLHGYFIANKQFYTLPFFSDRISNEANVYIRLIYSLNKLSDVLTEKLDQKDFDWALFLENATQYIDYCELCISNEKQILSYFAKREPNNFHLYLNELTNNLSCLHVALAKFEQKEECKRINDIAMQILRWKDITIKQIADNNLIIYHVAQRIVDNHASFETKPLPHDFSIKQIQQLQKLFRALASNNIEATKATLDLESTASSSQEGSLDKLTSMLKVLATRLIQPQEITILNASFDTWISRCDKKGNIFDICQHQYLTMLKAFFNDKAMNDENILMQQALKNKEIAEAQALETQLQDERNIIKEQARLARKAVNNQKKIEKQHIRKYLKEQKSLIANERKKIAEKENHKKSLFQSQIDQKYLASPLVESEHSENDPIQNNIATNLPATQTPLGTLIAQLEILFLGGQAVNNYHTIVNDGLLSQWVKGIDSKYKDFWQTQSPFKAFLTMMWQQLDSNPVPSTSKTIDIFSLLLLPATLKFNSHHKLDRKIKSVINEFLSTYLQNATSLQDHFLKVDFKHYLHIELRKLFRQFHQHGQKTASKPVPVENLIEKISDNIIAEQSPLQQSSHEQVNQEEDFVVESNDLINDSQYLTQQNIKTIKVPEIISNLMQKIEKTQSRSYIVGGFVRDSLLSKSSKDIDIIAECTKAELDEILKYPLKENDHIKNLYEISLQDKDTTYKVDILLKEKGFDLNKDAESRDFTLNALYADADGQIYSPLVESEYHINSKLRLLHPIGDPKKDFERDPIRMLRAIDLSSKIDFELSANILEAFIEHRDKFASHPFGALKSHLQKMLLGDNCHANFNALISHNLLPSLIPGMGETFKAQWEDASLLKDFILQQWTHIRNDKSKAVRKDVAMIGLLLFSSMVTLDENQLVIKEASEKHLKQALQQFYEIYNCKPAPYLNSIKSALESNLHQILASYHDAISLSDAIVPSNPNLIGVPTVDWNSVFTKKETRNDSLNIFRIFDAHSQYGVTFSETTMKQIDLNKSKIANLPLESLLVQFQEMFLNGRALKNYRLFAEYNILPYCLPCLQGDLESVWKKEPYLSEYIQQRFQKIDDLDYKAKRLVGLGDILTILSLPAMFKDDIQRGGKFVLGLQNRASNHFGANFQKQFSAISKSCLYDLYLNYQSYKHKKKIEAELKSTLGLNDEYGVNAAPKFLIQHSAQQHKVVAIANPVNDPINRENNIPKKSPRRN